MPDIHIAMLCSVDLTDAELLECWQIDDVRDCLQENNREPCPQLENLECGDIVIPQRQGYRYAGAMMLTQAMTLLPNPDWNNRGTITIPRAISSCLHDPIASYEEADTDVIEEIAVPRNHRVIQGNAQFLNFRDSTHVILWNRVQKEWQVREVPAEQ